MKVLSADGLTKLIQLVKSTFSTKQDNLISGTNIKSINNQSLLGSGNITIQSGSSYTAGTGINITNDVISVTSPTITNSADGANSIVIGGSESSILRDYNVVIGYNSETISSYGAVAIGYTAKSSGYSTAIGYRSTASGNFSTAIGYSSGATSEYSIQLGEGVNSEANSFYVSTSGTNNWKMLGSDGIIPVERISTMSGSDGVSAGSRGLVPAPSSTDNTRYLRGDGSWSDAGELITNQRDLSNIKVWQGNKNQHDEVITATWYNWKVGEYSWESRGSLPSSGDWRIAFGNNTFVAISASGDSAYSTDNGKTWTSGGSLPGTGWSKIAYGGGVFVAIADNSQTWAYSNDDGKNWTSVQAPSSQVWNSLVYGAGNFVAAGASGNFIVYSSNGSSWNTTTFTGTVGPMFVSYGKISDNDYIFSLVPSGQNNTSYRSSDGVSWIQDSSDSFAPAGITFLTYAGTRFFTAITTGLFKMSYYYSPSSNYYTSYPYPSKINALGSGTMIPITNGDLLIIAKQGSSDFMYTNDTIDWTSSTMSESGSWSDGAYGNDTFMLVTSNSDTVLCYTKDFDTVYTLDEPATTTSVVYSAPDIETQLRITSSTSTTFTLSTGIVYQYNPTGNTTTSQSIATDHPDWLCFIDNEGVKLGTTVIADRTSIATSVDSSSTNADAVGAKLFYDTCGDIETLINAL